MSKVFVVDDGGCSGVGCCVETVGVFSSIDAIRKTFPNHEYVPTQWGYGQLVNNNGKYVVEYYVYSFEMDVRK